MKRLSLLVSRYPETGIPILTTSTTLHVKEKHTKRCMHSIHATQLTPRKAVSWCEIYLPISKPYKQNVQQNWMTPKNECALVFECVLHANFSMLTFCPGYQWVSGVNYRHRTPNFRLSVALAERDWQRSRATNLVIRSDPVVPPQHRLGTSFLFLKVFSSTRSGDNLVFRMTR